MVHLYNQLSRYAATHEVTVTVVDTEGTAVENASIEFCVLNYSEYSPAALAVTDAQGKAVLETGYGSLYVQVEKDGVYTGKAFHCEKESELTVVLGDTSENGDIDMFAPVDTPVNTAVPSKEQKKNVNAVLHWQINSAQREAKTGKIRNASLFLHRKNRERNGENYFWIFSVTKIRQI